MEKNKLQTSDLATEQKDGVNSMLRTIRTFCYSDDNESPTHVCKQNDLRPTVASFVT